MQNLESRGRPLSELELLTLKRAALRIDAGRNYGFKYAEIGGIKMLIAASVTRGAIVYLWNFDQVEGLAGAASVTGDEHDDGVYAIGVLNTSLISMRRQPQYDDLGNLIRVCPDNKCLVYAGTLSEKDDRSTGPIEGLRGGRSVQMSSKGCDGGVQCAVIVSGGVPRDERLCGASGENVPAPRRPTGKSDGFMHVPMTLFPCR